MFVALTWKRIYRSETLILYREGISSANLGGADLGGDPARKLGLRLKEMVLSRSRLQQIIEEFKLYPEIVDDRGWVDAVDEMRLHIAFRVKDGDTFGLSFEADNPDRVQKVTAKLADVLILENSRTRTEQAEETREFLDREKKRNDEELKAKETNLATFLAKHPEFARETGQSAGGGGGGQAGSAIRAVGRSAAAAAAAGSGNSGDATVNALEREAARIQARLAVGNTHKTPLLDPRMQQQRTEAESEFAASQRDLGDKMSQFTEQHPDVKAAKLRVELARTRLKRANEALLSETARVPEESSNIDREALESALQKVNAEISSRKRKKRSEDGEAAPAVAAPSSSDWIVELETEWNRLNREVGETREKHQQLEDKQFKASLVESAASAGRDAQMQIVDEAFRPTHPGKPGRSTIAGAGLAISFFLSILMALSCAFFDDRIHDRVDLEQLEIAPLLSVVAKPSKKESLV